MYNVDGGYVSFKLAFGNFDAWELKYGKEVAIFAMDSRSARKDIDANYKANRIYGKDEAIRLVSDLRSHIMQSSKLPVCKIEGHEADDIVACWKLFNPDQDLVGLDKDFFQLPFTDIVLTHEFTVYEKQRVLDKCSNFICELASINWPLYQMLVGDVADNVPRLLAKGKQGKEQVLEILASIQVNDLENCLLSLFEDKIIHNAKLILCPFYKFANFKENEFFNAWASGQYYDKENWQGYYDLINYSMRANRVHETLTQLSLWGFDV